MERQRTIEREVSLSGRGIHTGKEVNVKFKPAKENTGIIFIRTDLKDRPPIKVDFNSIFLPNSGKRHTSLGTEEVHIHTVEHLLAVLNGLGIDNIYIEIDQEELPALDGSGKGYYEVLSSNIKEQDQQRKCYFIKEPIVVEEAKAILIAYPCRQLKISYTLDYPSTFLKTQFVSFEINPESFKELVEARTFCLEEEAKTLLEMGFGKGADYSNTLVIGKTGVINNSLRFEDEPARHKVLDLLGDLYLLGIPIKGHFVALRSGHSLNLKLIEKIKSQMERYSLEEEKETEEKEGQLSRKQIMEILPHRDPFLFVDKILSLEKGKRAVGVKYLKDDDYFFKGHFPGHPIMPGVLIIEAMAQVGGVMMLSLPQNQGKLAYFLACNNVKFRKTVLPGDELILEAETVKLKSKTGVVKGSAYVGNQLVAEAELVFTLVER
jgi:UDP-3-O-[3-hydroxymyristoyl] N-acetylglucosamine deacetylase/3-hydroxyacyl-[acyl-carrier-protein] dehydratase